MVLVVVEDKQRTLLSHVLSWLSTNDQNRVALVLDQCSTTNSLWEHPIFANIFFFLSTIPLVSLVLSQNNLCNFGMHPFPFGTFGLSLVYKKVK
jgi:hypothetical protein